MNSNKKILLIAYGFPPLISPQSLRWFYLVRELVFKGYSIDIITIKMPERFKDLLDEIPVTTEIHRTFPGFFHYFTYKYSRESKKDADCACVNKSSFFWKMLSSIHRAVFKFLNFLCIPDIYIEWLPFSFIKVLRLAGLKKYDVVISSSEPRTCHLVAYLLKKKVNIPWLADFGDPWVYPIPTEKISSFKRYLLYSLENRVIRNAERITVASEGIERLYNRTYNVKDKVYNMAQGYDPYIFSKIKVEISRNFKIVYCGSFYKKLRDPSAFFEAITEIDRDDIKVEIAGRINEFAITIEKNYSKHIKYLGFLNHEDSLKLEKTATILLHLGNASDMQIPGKIYEYFGAQRPILCIEGSGGDPSSELVNKYNRGVVVENDKYQIKKAIMKLYDFWTKGILDNEFELGVCEEFSWRKRSDILANIIEGL